ncbi:ABC-2 type transporter [Denitrovibrio acetiphilus DSM 12809]|uniref:ABC-2 type transporter n=1 Tax=Denitrovibrio acetiphilus (strain DSM 12809 / NBRC 114555 / N2460) TaxID=522772 RepID=D4H5G7_DENA2|nr:ABC transporter permease [Denitrovibrio acetiphilus]ADD67587.1 ABC-2 type transporter [Denitrovibrio acetiphilus DSM 12809]
MNSSLSFRRLNAIVVKEFIHILRDWRSLGLAIAIPVLLLILFGYALNMDLKNVPIGVYDISMSKESSDLLSLFDGSQYFEIKSYYQNTNDLENDLKKKIIKAGVIIDQHFGKSIYTSAPVHINIVIDGADANTGRLILNYSQALASIYNTQIIADSASLSGSITASPRSWYNQGLDSTYNLVPGITAIVMVVIASMLASVTVAKEWEMGTIEQLISTPVTRLEITLGKAIPLYAVGLADVIIATVLGMVIFDVPLRGQPALVILVASVFLIGVLFYGLLLSITLKSQVLANQIALLSGFLPTLVLSGFIFTIANMPLPVQILTHFFPARYFISMLKSIYLKGVGLEMMLLNFTFLTIYAALMVFLSVRKLKLRLD